MNEVQSEDFSTKFGKALQGLAVLAALVVAAPLVVAATFWTCGVAVRAFHWMVG